MLPGIREMNIDVPVFGMVKDSKHRTRAISTGGGEIEIQSKRSAFTLVSVIQEEVHRFAITYHHNKHKKSTLQTSLTKIEGIGDAKAKILLKEFKTVGAVKTAGVEQLAAVSGISRKNAEDIYNFYNK